MPSRFGSWPGHPAQRIVQDPLQGKGRKGGGFTDHP
jgi:hypothetical protein